MATHEQENGRAFLTTSRIEALTDGVFSIAMTLLVLELRIPDGTDGAHLLATLREMWPVFLVYVASFVNLGIYWVGQHNQFHFIRYTDRIFLWINLAFLLFVSLIPFSTAVLGRYPQEQASYILYGSHIILLGIISYLHWCYATTYHRLVVHEIKDELVAYVKRRILFAPTLCLFAILISFISIPFALVLYLLIPIYYIIPNHIDESWRMPAVPHSHEHE